VTVTTLTDEPARFVEHDAVRFLMNVLGREVLPVVLVDGVMRAHRICPDREQLAGWVGLDHHVAVPPDDAVGAAIPSQASAHAFAPVPAEHVRRAAQRAGLRAERPLAAARLR
jgi:predicted  nucleic acid-binding Zn ribbon protein